MDEQLKAMAEQARAQRDAEFRARREANNRALGIGKDATPQEVHEAVMRLAER